MKLTSPVHIFSEQLARLHCMETQIARELPVLAGSVMNADLRRMLTGRAMRARARRNHLADLLRRHAHPLVMRMQDSIRSILAEGNKDLARIHQPCARDVAMIEHCIRIEQHATTAYGIAVPLTHRIGYPRISAKLRLLLGDLETARLSYQAREAEVFSIAARHPCAEAEKPHPATPAGNRNAVTTGEMLPMAVGY